MPHSDPADPKRNLSIQPGDGNDGKKKPKFELPRVLTSSGDEILEELGPAHACSPFSGSIVGC